MNNNLTIFIDGKNSGKRCVVYQRSGSVLIAKQSATIHNAIYDNTSRKHIGYFVELSTGEMHVADVSDVAITPPPHSEDA